MSGLADRAEQYLSLRRDLGFKLVAAGHMLPQFAAYCQDAGSTTVTVQLAVEWAQLPEGVQPIYQQQRLGAVRGFARWLATIDPETQVPPPGLLAGRQQRREPYIYTADQIDALLEATRRLIPKIRTVSYETLLGLLACTGMRISEALFLARGDVDLSDGIITVRHAKAGRERILPLHPSVTEALRRYTRRRDHLCPTPECRERFFISTGGIALTLMAADHTFTRLTTWAALPTGAHQPRIHDLRHAAAVATLTDWYRSGDDAETITSRLPLLSTYLGHVSPVSTYWYITAVPELMQLAARRLAANQATGTES